MQVVCLQSGTLTISHSHSHKNTGAYRDHVRRQILSMLHRLMCACACEFTNTCTHPHIPSRAHIGQLDALHTSALVVCTHVYIHHIISYHVRAYTEQLDASYASALEERMRDTVRAATLPLSKQELASMLAAKTPALDVDVVVTPLLTLGLNHTSCDASPASHAMAVVCHKRSNRNRWCWQSPVLHTTCAAIERRTRYFPFVPPSDAEASLLANSTDKERSTRNSTAAK